LDDCGRWRRVSALERCGASGSPIPPGCKQIWSCCVPLAYPADAGWPTARRSTARVVSPLTDKRAPPAYTCRVFEICRGNVSDAARPRIKRRLAAILVAGYSRLLPGDEVDRIADLRAVLTETIQPLIAEYDGNLFKEAGDLALVEFESVVEATRCAAAIRDALRRARPLVSDAVALVRTAGGADIAAMAAFLAQAAVRRTPVILDGVVVGAAAMLAEELAPGARQWWVAGHRSAEPAHTLALEHLELTPVLDLGMRLGEGSGAVVALPLVQMAVRVLAEMATFADAGVSRPAGAPLPTG